MISNRLQAFFCFFLMSFVLTIQAMDQGDAHVGVPQAPQQIEDYRRDARQHWEDSRAPQAQEQTQVPQQTWKRWLIQKASHMLARSFPTWTKIVGGTGLFCGYLGLKRMLFPNAATKGARIANLLLNSAALCCSIRRAAMHIHDPVMRARPHGDLERDEYMEWEMTYNPYPKAWAIFRESPRLLYLGIDTGSIIAGYQGFHDVGMQNTMKRVDRWIKLGRPDMAHREQSVGKGVSRLVHGLCEVFRAEPLLRLADKGADTLRAALHDRCERYLQP